MKPTQIVIFLVLLIGALVAISDMRRPRAPKLTYKVQGQEAYMSGTTDSYSAKLIKDLRRDHPQVQRLILKSMPGTEDVVTNTRIARQIRKAALATHIPANGYIASGAVDWFIAGSPRTIECGAKIGVHSWGSKLGARGDKTIYDPHRSMQRNFLRDMGVDPDFYDFTRAAAGPDDIYWLSLADMLRYGLLSQAPNCE